MQLVVVYVLSSSLYKTEYLFPLHLCIDVYLSFSSTFVVVLFVCMCVRMCTESEYDYCLVLVSIPVDNHELLCVISSCP